MSETPVEMNLLYYTSKQNTTVGVLAPPLFSCVVVTV
jgi:hypothetical protein